MARPVKVEINKGAFMHNLSLAREKADGAGLMPVLKADAYGHGLAELCRWVPEGDTIALTSIDEACIVRGQGIKNTVLLLEGCFSADELNWCAANNIETVVHSQHQIDDLARFCESVSNTGHLSVWIKFDTGMHRLGFPCDQAGAALLAVKRLDRVKLCGALTHMACADDIANRKTGQQMLLFEEKVLAPYSWPAVSLANSAVLMNYPDNLHNLVRPGIMLYGGSCDVNKTGVELGLRAVMSFRSEIIAIRTIGAGESVGYGGRWVSTRESKVGVVAVGYADGYPRHAPDGTPVWLNGVIAPMVGRVSMDMITVDLTDVPEAKVADRVELWGENLSVDLVANHCETIAYELMTSITRRVPKIYPDLSIIR
ncbi:MAG: alanine racemase [Proteobacteria bacterium]|nr:MAG: alanine racemase [Pseudomonadota bacterium]PIE40232.1 MAG: alanine racemase [Gammaproteobacteria bacterium]